MSQPTDDDLRLGFLTTLEVEPKGLIGGLLVTNRFGRPLEFHCTAPIRASKTQEILYGRTLRPYLKCDLIGQTLLQRTAVKPDVVLTCDAELLPLRELQEIPVACCGDSQESTDDPPPATLQIAGQTLRFHSAHQQDDADRLKRHSSRLPQDADLSEPLDRVREALAETARSGS